MLIPMHLQELYTSLKSFFGECVQHYLQFYLNILYLVQIFQLNINLGKRRKMHGAKSDEYGRQGTYSMLFFN